MSLSISKDSQGDSIRLVLKGEIDVSNAQELTDALESAIASTPARIEVDMGGVPYIDSTGIGQLVAGSKNAQSKDIELKVTAPQPNVMRVLTMLGVLNEFNVDN